MAFRQVGSQLPFGAPVLRSEILANSVTFTELDSVKAASGFIALGTAGATVFGHIHGIATNKGVGLNTSGAAGAEMGSFVGTFLTASDNQTVAKNRGVIDVSKFSQYAEITSGTLGATTGSNLLGYHLDLTDEDTIDETSAITGTAQYFNWGVNPANSLEIIVSIYESQVYGV